MEKEYFIKEKKQMTLAQNETVIKQWDYAKSKQGRERTQLSLTLTNRRLISTTESQMNNSKTEIPLESIKGLNFSVCKVSNIIPILSIIFGILNLIIIIGVFFIIWGVRRLNRGAFYMSVSISGVDRVFAGADTGLRKGNKHRLTVKVDRDNAQDIADTIGATIMDMQGEKS